MADGCTETVEIVRGVQRRCGYPVVRGGRCDRHAPPLPEVDAAAISKVPRKNTKGGEAPRVENDAYYTPDLVARAICRTLRKEIGFPQVVIEPSAGRGAFVRAARAVWGNVPEIVALERERAPNFRELDVAGANEVIWGTWERADGLVPERPYEDTILILGNPPFSLETPAPGKPTTAEAHVQLALQRLGHYREQRPVRRYCAFLLRSSFLAGQERSQRLHARGGLRYVWNIEERPSFTGGGTDGAEYALMVWQAGYRGRYEGDWLSWAEEP